MSHPNSGWPQQQFQQPQPFQQQQQQFYQPPPGVPLAAPAQQPQQSQQPPVQQQPAQLTADTIIPRGDPIWPQELWGKPLREALRIYGVMKEDFLRRNIASQPQQQFQQQQQQPQQLQQPQPQRQQQPQSQPLPQSLDPQSIQQMIQEGIRQGLAQSPMAMVTAETVMGQVRMRYADWNQYHLEILQEINGVPADALMSPTVWEQAYWMVKGRALSRNQTPVYQPQYDNGNAPNGYGQPRRDPAGAIVSPPPAFTEAPSSQPPPSNGVAALINDPRIVTMARRFGMSPEAYAAEYARQMGL